jgi:hypothetical protein
MSFDPLRFRVAPRRRGIAPVWPETLAPLLRWCWLSHGSRGLGPEQPHPTPPLQAPTGALVCPGVSLVLQGLSENSSGYRHPTPGRFRSPRQARPGPRTGVACLRLRYLAYPPHPTPGGDRWPRQAGTRTGTRAACLRLRCPASTPFSPSSERRP